MSVDNQEKLILDTLKAKGGKISYKELQSICENQFEGVRLILKKLKEKGYVTYDGPIPGFSAIIELIKK
jgi:uncharacterized membrane protein